jgi:hypothetical protein
MIRVRFPTLLPLLSPMAIFHPIVYLNDIFLTVLYLSKRTSQEKEPVLIRLSLLPLHFLAREGVFSPLTSTLRRELRRLPWRHYRWERYFSLEIRAEGIRHRVLLAREVVRVMESPV